MNDPLQPQAGEVKPFDPPPKKKHKGSTREFVEAILIALVLALFIRTFIVQAFKIPSGSMIPTLLVGDHILVNKFVYGIPIPFADRKLVTFREPQRGEVIVFRYPVDPSLDFIKRVVGTPGDTISIEDGTVHVNGEPVELELQERYVYEEPGGVETITASKYTEVLNDSAHTIIFSDDEFPQMRNYGPVTVPEGKLLTFGDNRDSSNDGRYWGFVDIEAVRGRAILIYWSWDREDTRVRMDRLGNMIR